MIFSDHFFLLYFFPPLLLLYLLSVKLSRSLFFPNLVLIVGSLLFYATFGINSISILLIPIVFDFFLAIALHHTRHEIRRRYLFALGLTINVLILGYYKYSIFLATQLNTFFSFHILKTYSATELILPVGISFITFQRISYLTDIYKKKINACTNIFHYLTYALLFPHIIAGPIVRYSEISEELKKRLINHRTFFEGVKYFSIGLALKVFIADQLFLVDEFLISRLAQLDSLQTGILVFTYSFRLYFDFLGYSLMAIGVAAFFGFHFPDNFDSPYSAQSLTEFWRKWNISLSLWIRDYIFIPLGGSRDGLIKTLLNLMTAMVFAGIWHGAGWNFIIWGLLHGVWLSFERLIRPFSISRFFPIRLRQLTTFIGVSLLWIPFRFSDWDMVETTVIQLSHLTFHDLDQLTHNTVVSSLPAVVLASIWIIGLKEKSIKNISPSLFKLVLFSCLLFFSLFISLTKRNIQFIYFQF